MCPGTVVVDPGTGQPLPCQLHEGCISAACDVDITAAGPALTMQQPPQTSLQGLVEFQVDPGCSSANDRPSILLTLSGGLSNSNDSGASNNVVVTGPGQVVLEQGEQLVGNLNVQGWNHTRNPEALTIATEVSG